MHAGRGHGLLLKYAGLSPMFEGQLRNDIAVQVKRSFGRALLEEPGWTRLAVGGALNGRLLRSVEE
eukprot:8996784-Lingulodinium_polyedra.AAC.1